MAEALATFILVDNARALVTMGDLVRHKEGAKEIVMPIFDKGTHMGVCEWRWRWLWMWFVFWVAVECTRNRVVCFSAPCVLRHHGQNSCCGHPWLEASSTGCLTSAQGNGWTKSKMSTQNQCWRKNCEGTAFDTSMEGHMSRMNLRPNWKENSHLSWQSCSELAAGLKDEELKVEARFLVEDCQQEFFIFTNAVICNGQNHMDGFRNQKKLYRRNPSIGFVQEFSATMTGFLSFFGTAGEKDSGRSEFWPLILRVKHSGCYSGATRRTSERAALPWLCPHHQELRGWRRWLFQWLRPSEFSRVASVEDQVWLHPGSLHGCAVSRALALTSPGSRRGVRQCRPSNTPSPPVALFSALERAVSVQWSFHG